MLREPIVSEGKSVLLTLALALASAVPASAHFAERQRSFSAYVESTAGGSRPGGAGDRNVELFIRMPTP